MKRTILYAYIALMVAVGLPFLADLGGQGAQKSSGAVNPTPTAAVDEAPPSALPRAADPVTPSPLPDAPEPAALPAPDRLTVLLPDGTVTAMDTQDYLTGVVSAEMPPGFHAEALRAQAVAARTYALYCASFSKHGEAQVCTDYRCCQAGLCRFSLVLRLGDGEQRRRVERGAVSRQCFEPGDGRRRPELHQHAALQPYRLP